MEDKTEGCTKPCVDIIIPVYKPGPEFKNILGRLLRQTVPLNHIYLLQTIDNGSSLMEDLAEGIVSVHPVLKKEFDHGATRRFGAGLSDAEFMLFMTQDAIPRDNKLVEKLLVPMAGKNIAVSYGRLYNYPKESSVKSKNDLDRLGIKTYFCSDVCAMYRKSVYEELGGFVKKTIFNEDMIMASKVINAGYNIAYCAEAKVIHSHSYTCVQQFKRNFDLGVSQKQYSGIFENISSEKEGAGYAGRIIKSLVKRGKPFKAFYFVLQCVFKFAGYKSGLNYDKLPEKFILKCTMNKGYWT